MCAACTLPKTRVLSSSCSRLTFSGKSAGFGCRNLSSALLSAVSLSSFDRMATVTPLPSQARHPWQGTFCCLQCTEKHHIVLFLLGSSHSEGKIRAIPPSNRVTLIMTSTSLSFSFVIYMEIRVANTKTCKKHAAHAHCTRTVVPPGAHRRSFDAASRSESPYRPVYHA